MSLADELRAAGLTVKERSGWTTRGGDWSAGDPVGVMQHHTAPPVPYPLSGLDGSSDGRIKCNINTKPDGTVWLVAYRACNYSSGGGSSTVLRDVRNGRVPTDNAKERGLSDDTNGNSWFFNFENDHAGDGSKIPSVQLDAIITATQVVLEHYNLPETAVISHAEWTRRKIDPRWNGSNRTAIEQIRQGVSMGHTHNLPPEKLPRSWADGLWEKWVDRSGNG